MMPGKTFCRKSLPHGLRALCNEIPGVAFRSGFSFPQQKTAGGRRPSTVFLRSALEYAIITIGAVQRQ